MNILHTTPQFDAWFDALKDAQVKSRVHARLDRAEDGNFGDCKPVGAGVSEMRIHHGAGWRVYFMQSGQAIYVLLAGGDKSTQSADIAAAQALARTFTLKAKP